MKLECQGELEGPKRAPTSERGRRWEVVGEKGRRGKKVANTVRVAFSNRHFQGELRGGRRQRGKARVSGGRPADVDGGDADEWREDMEMARSVDGRNLKETGRRGRVRRNEAGEAERVSAGEACKWLKLRESTRPVALPEEMEQRESRDGEFCGQKFGSREWASEMESRDHVKRPSEFLCGFFFLVGATVGRVTTSQE